MGRCDVLEARSEYGESGGISKPGKERVWSSAAASPLVIGCLPAIPVDACGVC